MSISMSCSSAKGLYATSFTCWLCDIIYHYLDLYIVVNKSFRSDDAIIREEMLKDNGNTRYNGVGDRILNNVKIIWFNTCIYLFDEDFFHINCSSE